MNKTIKIISILMIAIMLCAVSTRVFADNSVFDTSLIGKVETEVQNSNATTEGVEKIAGNVLKVIRNIAVIAAVVLITILGVKYMLGSAEEKSGYQKSFIPLIVGIVVVAAATQIATMIFSVFK